LRTAYPTICATDAAERALLPGSPGVDFYVNPPHRTTPRTRPTATDDSSHSRYRRSTRCRSPTSVRNGRHVPRAVVAVERPPVLAVQHGIVNQRAIWIDPAELPVRRAGLTPYPIAEPVQASKRVAERFRFPLEPTQALLARARLRTLAIRPSRIAAPDGRWDVSGVAMGYLWG